MNHIEMKPRRESQRARSRAIEATEQDSVPGSVNSASELRALCDKNVPDKSVMHTGPSRSGSFEVERSFDPVAEGVERGKVNVEGGRKSGAVACGKERSRT